MKRHLHIKRENGFCSIKRLYNALFHIDMYNVNKHPAATQWIINDIAIKNIQVRLKDKCTSVFISKSAVPSIAAYVNYSLSQTTYNFNKNVKLDKSS